MARDIDIISVPIVLEEGRIDSRYRLIIVASQRAQQLMEGSTPQIQTRYKKPTTIALQEYLEGKLEFYTGEEARTAQREARRLQDEEMRSRALKARERDITTEVKKELSVYVDDSERKAAPESKE